MDENSQIWREYYQKALSRPHHKRTEFAVTLNQSPSRVAVDCGCGTGSDIDYLERQGYQVHGFDVNPDSVAICRDRFANNALVEISQSSFEAYDYPQNGLVIANSSLFFAEPSVFEDTWHKLAASIAIGGVFAGDFMGTKDSWVNNYRSSITPVTESKLQQLLVDFDIIKFDERDESARTSLGKLKHWNTYSVVAIKCR